MRLPEWDDTYPDPEVLRAEVDAFIDAVSVALFEHLGDAITGLWLKGSAGREAFGSALRALELGAAIGREALA